MQLIRVLRTAGGVGRPWGVVLGLVVSGLCCTGPAMGEADCTDRSEWFEQTYPDAAAPNVFERRAGGALLVRSENSGSLIYTPCGRPLHARLSWKWRSSGAWNVARRQVDITHKSHGDRRLALGVGFSPIEGGGSIMSRLSSVFAHSWNGLEQVPDIIIFYTWADGYAENTIHRYGTLGADVSIVVLDGRDGGSKVFRAFDRDLRCDYFSVTQPEREILMTPRECAQFAIGRSAKHAVSVLSLSADTEFTGSRIRSEVVDLAIVPVQ